MSLAARFTEYVRACFTGIWIESHEHQDALAELAAVCSAEQWQLAMWDNEQGLSVAGAGTDAAATGQDAANTK